MMYSAFAGFYDELTGNISYEERASYFDSIIKEFKTEGPILLDLACGTGSLSVEFSRLGYDVIGVDNSADMLSVALEKKYEAEQDILFPRTNFPSTASRHCLQPCNVAQSLNSPK